MLRLSISAVLMVGGLGGCVATAATGQTEAIAISAPAQAASVGLDGNALDVLAADIRQGDFGNTHALLVFQENKLAHESYFVGDDRQWGRRREWERSVEFGPGRLHDARSISKTVVSTLVGIAIRDGHIPSADTPLHDLLPSYQHLLTGKKRQLTLRHLLTMTPGLQWNEMGAGPNDESRMYESADPTAFVLQRPLVAEPGTVWEYSGGTSHLLGVILEGRTGRPIEEYARQVLFEPLGISTFEWRGDVAGMPAAASGLRLLPRDFAKLGRMFEDNGRSRGRQVGPAQWLAEAMQLQIEIARHHRAPSWSLRSGYGFQWWHDEFAGPQGPFRVSTARGLGGQRIFVVPQYDLVVVVLSGHYGKPDASWTPEHILQRVVQALRV
ncbi:MAG: serine hydrolase domain-containing protein [Sphingomicrobium sp.]